MDTQLKPVDIDGLDFFTSKYAFPRFSKTRIDVFGSIGPRGPYLWEWAIQGAKMTCLNLSGSEPTAEINTLRNKIKLWGVLWDVLVDDVADEMPLDKAVHILPHFQDTGSDTSGLSPVEIKYIEYAAFVMASVFKSAQALPGFETHREDLVSEYKNLFDTMSYACETRKDPSNVSLKKYQDILSLNMHMVINGVIDLMAIDYPEKVSGDNNLRKLFLLGQRMGRIGNATTTYARELPQGDYSSEVIAFALEEGVVSIIDLQKMVYYRDGKESKALKTLAKDLIKRIEDAGIPKKLWEQWAGYKEGILPLIPEFPDLDIKGYVDGLTDLRKLHENSVGSK